MMKRFSILSLAALMAATSAASAEEGPYLSGAVGLHMPRSSNATIGGAGTTIDFDDGFAGIAALGWKWEDGFRTEFELGYRESDVDTFGAGAGTGDQDIFSAMGNILFDIDTGSSFKPYVGAGLGLGWVGWDSVSGPAASVYDGTESGFTWQGIVGAAIAVSERVDLTLDYRYMNTNGLDYAGTPASTLADHDARSHNIMLGLRFALWEPAPKPQPVAEPAPAPAPPPPMPEPEPEPAMPEKFLVFFDWDKANLTDQARTIVQDAAAFASRTGAARIQATGHADRSGSVSYNLGLSERRAQAVKAELVRRGIPENEIVIMWRGESEPLVQTDDGVREPQNRRVEIVIE